MKVTFTHNGEKYTLEYTLDTVKKMENAGFSVDKFLEEPANGITTLFAGAFIAHHKHVKRDKIEEILRDMEDSKELLSTLVEMYNDPINSLLEGAAEGNGIKWEKA